MSGINKVILVGNLGKDPEVRHLEGGAVVAKFPLATSESYKTKDGQRVDQTEWHNVVMWRGLAESAEKFLRKGSLVYIEGKIRTRSWDDKDGNKRHATEIVADTMTMLGAKRNEDHAPSAVASQSYDNGSANGSDEGPAF
ncbi:MAG: single-stranded DNA-binding protein [Bacteroidota bacterium]